MRLIQCVPNFSEGRDQEKIEAIVSAIRGRPGVFVWDTHADPDHNRLVVALAGEPQAVLAAVFMGAKTAVELIDMRRHEGGHPRIGAVDVIALIALFDVSLQECIGFSKNLGARLATELNLPVYLYGEAATKKERKELSQLRRGGFEGLLSRRVATAAEMPDFGQTACHPSAGAVAVGVRDQIINLNVNLASQDLVLAKEAAAALRASSGGLAGVQAIGLALKSRDCVQVSTVLREYGKTGVVEVVGDLERCLQERVSIKELEFVGPVPAQILLAATKLGYPLINFNPEKQLLENNIVATVKGLSIRPSSDNWFAALKAFCEALSAPVAVPSGGTVSAATAAMGMALLVKIIAMSRQRTLKENGDKYSSEHVQQLFADALSYQERFLELAQENARAHEKVFEVFRRPKISAHRAEDLEEAFHKACESPLKVFHLAMEAINIYQPRASLIHPKLASDLKIAVFVLIASCRSARENLLINLDSVTDATFRVKVQAEIAALEAVLKEKSDQL